MSVKDCLLSIVGLSSNDCACFEDGRPADYNTSLSGYYMDDPEYGFPLNIPKTIKECETNDLWNIMERAQDTGITMFLTDFGANLLSGPFKRKAEPFNDWVGRYKWNMNLGASSIDTKVGLKINPWIFRGTIAKVYQLELYITGRDGDTITVEFYDDPGMLSATPVATADVVIASGKGTLDLAAVFEHDFMNDYSQKNKLWILYDPGVGLPRNTTIKCATCGKQDPWYDYMTVQGVKGADTNEIYDTTTYSGYSYGLRLSMGVSCGNSWLCQNFDYDNDNWARVMAECLALYQMKSLAGIILKDLGPNRYTQLTREEIGYHRDRINKLLGERMPWLAENVPSTAADCFTCNNQISAKELLV